MDLVLGLAMTSRAVRWVLVEGTTGEGRPVDRGAISFEDAAGYDPDGLLRAWWTTPNSTAVTASMPSA